MKYFFLFLFIFIPNLLEAATVKKISRKKRLVIIDEGMETGFVKGAKVCIYKEEKRFIVQKYENPKRLQLFFA